MSTASLRLGRRQALGLAVGGAAAAAGARVGLLHLGSPGVTASASGPAGSWASPLGDARGLAAHLLRRAHFAYSADELDRAARLSYSDLVDQVVGETPQAPPALPTSLVQYRAVSQWWLHHMATTSSQLPERVGLFWHGLLTSDYRKANNEPFVYLQNRLYREKGLGTLRDLLLAAATDPLMMRYLDLDRSTAKAPNENFSRELMELYTLGTGVYTETDVREGARALSGLRIVAFDRSGQRVVPAKAGKGAAARKATAQEAEQLVRDGGTYRGVLAPAQHDHGSKTFLGRTGNLGLTDVVDAILARPECARFVAIKALVHFALPSPSADLVERVAKPFRDSGYDIRTLLRTIFLSPEFRDPAQYRSLVRSPVDVMVATMRVLGRPELAPQCLQAASGLDQVLYDMPTVAGWPTGSGWLSSSTLLARVNFAQVAATAKGSLPDPAAAVALHLDGVVGPDLAEVFDGSSTQQDRWYAVLASPEFHLK